MSAAHYNLKISRGEDFSFTLTIRDNLEAPIVITVTGNQFKAEIREEFKKPLIQSFAFQTKTAVSGQSTADSVLNDGQLRFKLTSAQTLLFDVNKRYKWDFFWTDVGGSKHRLLYGDVIIGPNITHL
jgi:hypothetical protein